MTVLIIITTRQEALGAITTVQKELISIFFCNIFQTRALFYYSIHYPLYFISFVIVETSHSRDS